MYILCYEFSLRVYIQDSSQGQDCGISTFFGENFDSFNDW